eukprot:27344_5
MTSTTDSFWHVDDGHGQVWIPFPHLCRNTHFGYNPRLQPKGSALVCEVENPGKHRHGCRVPRFNQGYSVVPGWEKRRSWRESWKKMPCEVRDRQEALGRKVSFPIPRTRLGRKRFCCPSSNLHSPGQNEDCPEHQGQKTQEMGLCSPKVRDRQASGNQVQGRACDSCLSLVYLPRHAAERRVFQECCPT